MWNPFCPLLVLFWPRLGASVAGQKKSTPNPRCLTPGSLSVLFFPRFELRPTGQTADHLPTDSSTPAMSSLPNSLVTDTGSLVSHPLISGMRMRSIHLLERSDRTSRSNQNWARSCLALCQRVFLLRQPQSQSSSLCLLYLVLRLLVPLLGVTWIRQCSRSAHGQEVKHVKAHFSGIIEAESRSSP